MYLLLLSVNLDLVIKNCKVMLTKTVKYVGIPYWNRYLRTQ